MKMIRGFFCSLALVVLTVLYVGLVVSGLLAILAGILRTVGIDQIKMSIWQGVDLPVVFSIPLALVVSGFLFYCSLYVKRSMTFCFSKLKI
ncbi:hypothetical protein ACIP9C_16630 [Lysinibacillus sp. NPDC093210]|jgi:uncharacterized integral membrane protein|uniref:hypothetical protein n=1 Tax=Lysinibacillus sp. NPDC093210 TaxID=3364133 RepID=UPI0038047A26